ncbi:MAG: CPBP family intramembrane metalloprotease [Bacteroidetes bacterium]|nr:CPBP family intramembrane metalloprotease [Bacteroidota bacterium]
MEEPPIAEPVSDFWVKRDELRPVWKLSSYFTMFLFLFLGLYVISTFLPAHDWRLINPLIMLVSAVLPAILLLRSTDRRAVLPSLGLQWNVRSPRQLLAGFVLAVLMMSLLLLLELVAGGARMFLGRFPLMHVLHILSFGLVSFTLVSFAEEILLRGYPFDVLLRQSSTGAAVLLTSVLFSIMHAMNPEIGWMGFANILLAGIWLGTARVVTGSLWMAIGLHTGWNFSLGTLFGFPVSGIHERSLFITETSGPAILTGGTFGPEGGLLATLVLLIGTGTLFLPAVRGWIAGDAVAKTNETEHEVMP